MAISQISFISIIKSIGNKIIVLALGVLVSLAVLEVSLRVIGIVYSHLAQEGNAFKRKKPWAFGYWGLTSGNKYDPICYFLPRGGFFRGPNGRIDSPLEKEEHTIRIICIGDSVTYGAGEDYYHSWVYLLGTMLNRKYPEKRIEVLNAGLSGVINKQIKRIFQFHLAKYRPDILIWRGSTNLSDTYFVDTTPDFVRSFICRFLYEFRIFRVFCVLADRGNRGGIPAMADNIYDFITGRSPQELKQSVGGFDSDFSMVRKIAQEHGTKYALQAEYLTRLVDGSLHSETTTDGNKPIVKMMNAFKENDAKIPLLTNEKQVNRETKLPDTLFLDHCHLTEKGEVITAEEIYKFIVQNKWIETFS